MRLVDESTDRRPLPVVVHRLYNEKKAYLLYEQGRFSDAVDSYDKALTLTFEGHRARIKIRGGRALAVFMGSSRESTERETLRQEMTEVAGAAKNAGYPDVLGWARQNLDLLPRGSAGPWVAFERP